MPNSIPVPSFLSKVLEERKGFKKGELFTSKLDGVDDRHIKSFGLYDMYRAIGKRGSTVFISLEDEYSQDRIDSELKKLFV
jgi:hypothetical protein